MGALRQGRPADTAGRPERELACYDFLDALGIQYRQMDRDPAGGEEEAAAARAVLEAMVCKNILLRNRKGSRFYLLMLPWYKHFVTGEVTGQLGVSHLSFASAEEMDRLLGCAPGSVSVLGLRLDRERQVQLVMDRAVAEAPAFACHPCTNTASVRMSMEDFLGKVLPALGHPPAFIHLPQALDG